MTVLFRKSDFNSTIYDGWGNLISSLVMSGKIPPEKESEYYDNDDAEVECEVLKIKP
jgi:hypothetical protein